MSTCAIKEPVEKIFPCLIKLKESHFATLSLVRLMESFIAVKESQIDDTLSGILQFQQAVKESINIHIKSINEATAELSQIRVHTQCLAKQIQLVQIHRPQLSSSKRNKTMKVKQVEINSQPTDRCQKSAAAPTPKQETSVNKFTHYTSAQSNLARLSLVRNRNFCQAHLRLYIIGNKHVDYRKLFKHFICSMCPLVFRSTQYFNELQQHYETVHKTKYKSSLKGECYNTFQIFQMMKSKIENNQLTLYHCNCTSKFMALQQQYIEHIQGNHKGEVPPYSSHFIEKKGRSAKVVINEQCNQLCVLEDMIMPEFYYCGTCQDHFGQHAALFYKHFKEYHDGINQPDSSHYLTEKTENIHNLLKSKEEINNKNEQKDYDISCLRWVLKQYQGPYTCSLCSMKFASYDQMVSHFNQGSTANKRAHIYSLNDFIKIGIKRHDHKYFLEILYLPVNPKNKKISNHILQVPMPYNDQNKRKYETMTYTEFMKKLCTCSFQKSKGYYSFGWYI